MKHIFSFFSSLCLCSSLLFMMALSSVQAAAPVAHDDILLVAAGSNVTTDYLLANDTDADDDALSITATSNPAHGTLVNNNDGSYTYSPDAGFVGDDSFTYDVSDGTTTVTATVRVSVNATINREDVRDALLANVAKLNNLNYIIIPSYLAAWGPTSVVVSNFPGEDERYPMLVASTMGSGRVVTMGYNLWLNMDTYGYSEDNDDFYLNSIAWLADSPDKTIKIVTFGVQASTFLADKGFTNVVAANNTNVVAELATADIFIAHFQDNASLPNALRDAAISFVKGGGGLFLCDYGIFYNETQTVPGNQLVRDAGIGFSKSHDQFFNTFQPIAINRASNHYSDDYVVNVLKNMNTQSTEDKSRTKDLYKNMMESLEPGDTLHARLTEAIEFATNSLFPTPDTPVTDDLSKLLLTDEMNRIKDLPVSEVTAHRTAEALYGAIPAGTPRVTRIVNVDTSIPRWHSTGLYAAPGEILTITVPASVTAAGYRIRLSGHTDDNTERDGWKRVPFGTSRDFALDATTVQIASAFGGAVYIDTGTSKNVTPSFDLTIQNAIEAPYFVLGTTTNAQWATIRNNPAPYAELVCDRLIISIPSSFIRNVDQMEEIMTYWNEVVARQDYVGGVEDLRAEQMAERINIDVQIKVGYLHAGYPIQGPTASASGLVDYAKLTSEGNWGYFHELGHEAQRRPDKLWNWGNPYTTENEVEVTVNIFANAALEHMLPNVGMDATGGWTTYPDEVMRNALASVANGGTYESKDRYPYYHQLADGFGWEMYRNVFKTYHNDVLNNPSALPGNTAEKRDQWFLRWSQTAGVNMKKYMVDQWGMSISQSVLNQVSNLPDWLPVTGGLTAATVAKNSSKVLDIAGEALSYDNVATVSNVTQPAHGTIASNNNGTWTYTPNAGYVGSDTFSYDLTSSTNHTFTTEVTLRVGMGVIMERWDAVTGGTISNLTSDARYPNAPTHSSIIPSFESGENLANDYGMKMHAWLSVPTDGNYTFWIAADDRGELRLSTNADPANAQLIASVENWTGYRHWDKYPSQKSAEVYLKAGRKYYIEALMIESYGGDHLAVAWSGPGFGRKVISGEALFLQASESDADGDALADSWEVAHFGDTTSNNGSDDPDHDGKTNLAEFALDDAPNNPLSSGKVVTKMVQINGVNYLTLTFPVRANAVFSATAPAQKYMESAPIDGLIYRVESSNKLVFGDATSAMLIEEVSPALSTGLPALNPGWTYHTFRTSADATSANFMRIVIEQAP